MLKGNYKMKQNDNKTSFDGGVNSLKEEFKYRNF
jgi:hypothetical protein